MKRLVLLSLCAMMCVLTKAQEQESYRSAYVQGLWTNGTLTKDADFASGYNFTFGHQFVKSSGFFYELSLGIASRQAEWEGEDSHAELRTNAIQLSPLTVGVKTGAFEASIGAYGSYDLSGKMTSEFAGKKTMDVKIKDMEGFQRFDVGLKASVKLQWRALFVALHAQRGLVQMSDDEFSEYFWNYGVGLGIRLW